MDEPPDRRQEPAIRVLGVDARLDRVPVDRKLDLFLRQRFPGRHAQLPFDEVLPGDHFGDRMLDLQPRVHFHEIERSVAREAVGSDEFDGAGADIADRFRRGDRRFAHRAAMRVLHAGSRRLFEHFLMAPLHRAIALEQIDGRTVRIGEDLDLDVPGRGQVFLDQHAIVAERRLRLALRGRKRCLEIPRTFDDLHALAAASGGRLDQHRITDLGGFAPEQRGCLVIAVIAWDERNAGGAHDPLRGGFGAHRRDCGRRWADENEARTRAGRGKQLVLGQEAVPRMNRLRTRSLRDRDDRLAIQIALARRRRPEPVRLIAGRDMQRLAIGIGIDGHRADAHAPRGARDAHRNLAAVRNQDLVKHRRGCSAAARRLRR